MDILCLMGLFPQEYEDEINKCSKSGVQNAANKLQWAIVHGLDDNNVTPVSICNSLYIGSYPKKYTKSLIPTFHFSHADGAKDINVGFWNLPLFKIVSRYNGVWKYLKNWMSNDNGEEKCVLAYAMTLPFAKLIHDVKKKNRNIKVCLVVPDLPEYMNVTAMQTKPIYRFLKKCEIAYIKKCLKNVNDYVFLTEYMKNWFDREVNYVVVEGICSSGIEISDNKSIFQDDKKHIVYTGGIKKEYGVLDLISAFKQIKNTGWVLDLYGDGTHLEAAKTLAINDNRIVFHGSVPNKIAVMAQIEADLLINPRPNFEFAKYSFPSKILEYMLSGTPMLAYKLDGIPDEYYDYCFQIDDLDDGLVNSLRNVMEMSSDELKTMGNKAQRFVIENKNPRVQAQKILRMLGA